jgi:hypothetical protein
MRANEPVRDDAETPSLTRPFTAGVPPGRGYCCGLYGVGSGGAVRGEPAFTQAS